MFGKVTDGMDVVDKIENAPTQGADRPVEPTHIANIDLSQDA